VCLEEYLPLVNVRILLLCDLFVKKMFPDHVTPQIWYKQAFKHRIKNQSLT